MTSTAIMGKIDEYEEFSSPGYGNLLISRIEEFRNSDLFSDFKLTVEDQEFKVHRLVLAGCSDYFKAMFSHGMIESRKNELTLTTVRVGGIKPLLDFAYSGKLRLSLNSLGEVLPAATFLQITPVIQICHDYMKKRMNFENADEFVSLGMNFGLTDLEQFRSKLVLQNFEDYSQTQAFLQVEPLVLANWLKEDGLVVKTEGTLLKQVLRWYNHDPVKRSKDIHIVLENVRFVNDGWPCIEYAEKNEPFVSNAKCKELVDWAIEYMRLDCSRKQSMPQTVRCRVRCPYSTLVQFGGIQDHMEVMGDQIDRAGLCLNNYFHRELSSWFPLGVNGQSDMRSHAHMVAVNGFGILCGGYTYVSNGDTLQRRATNEVKWFTSSGFSMWDLPFMNEERVKHATAVAADYIYCVGGINENGVLCSVERYSLKRAVWRYCKPLSRSLYNHAGAGYQHKVFVCGGIESGHVSNRLLCYDPLEQNWEVKPEMLSARHSHSMTYIENQFIVCGGSSQEGALYNRCLSSVESFDLETEQWTFLTPMRIDCCDMSATVLEGNLLVLGGETSIGDLLDTVQQYDPRSQSWGYAQFRLPFKTRNASICCLKVKMSPDGEEETDSLEEEFINNHEEDDWSDVHDGNENVDVW